MYYILYSFKQFSDITNERKIIAETCLNDKERDLLNKLYYEPKIGYSDIKELSRKSKIPQSKVRVLNNKILIYFINL
jgi:hypothetical protein